MSEFMVGSSLLLVELVRGGQSGKRQTAIVIFVVKRWTANFLNGPSIF